MCGNASAICCNCDTNVGNTTAPWRARRTDALSSVLVSSSGTAARRRFRPCALSSLCFSVLAKSAIAFFREQNRFRQNYTTNAFCFIKHMEHTHLALLMYDHRHRGLKSRAPHRLLINRDWNSCAFDSELQAFCNCHQTYQQLVILQHFWFFEITKERRNERTKC